MMRDEASEAVETDSGEYQDLLPVAYGGNHCSDCNHTYRCQSEARSGTSAGSVVLANPLVEVQADSAPVSKAFSFYRCVKAPK